MKRVRLAPARRSADERQSSDMAVVIQLQRLVVRARASLGRGPGDDLVGILDVASLAVHAVGRVDLQAAAAAAVVDHLVDVRRTETLPRIAELRGATPGADTGVGDLEVHR